MAGKAKEEIGKVYGRLTVIERAFVKNETVYWKCKCECGSEVNVCGSNLRRVKRPTKSCGCLQIEFAKVLYKTVDNRKHSIEKLWLTTVRHHVKVGAKYRQINYSLEDEQLIKIGKSNCSYCGIEPSNYITVGRSDIETIYYQGVDRIDSSKGYSTDNVRPCCKDCNKAKSELSDENFKKLISRIYNHISENNNVD